MAKNNMLWLVKGTITVFNIPATFFVFLNLFQHSERPEWLAYFNTFMAILAVDVVFLWVIGVLESPIEPIKRLPAAITSILMVVLVVWIGIMDEGSLLAFAPRAGMLLLVFNDLVGWLTDYRQLYQSREFQERRIRDREVIERRKVDSQALKEVVHELKPKLKERHTKRILAQLGLEEVTERSVEIPKEETLPEFVFKTDAGFGWKSPINGEVFTQTTLGKPYSMSGAQIAASRHVKEHNHNGKSV
jgi:hypothetical protein